MSDDSRAQDELWALDGAPSLVADLRFPRGRSEVLALEMLYRSPEQAAMWHRSVTYNASGVARPTSAEDFVRGVVWADARAAIDAALLAGGLRLFDAITSRPTTVASGAFVLKSEVMALLCSPPKTLSVAPTASPSADADRADTESAARLVPETSEARDARLLDWFREEQAKQPRGALARVAERVGLTRQTVSQYVKRAKERASADGDTMSSISKALMK